MAAASNNKVKGLLKGLRYISQIFDNEKEEEMKIGNPTDVKHVAHIGYDGPSESSPSWMNEFKNPDGPGATIPNINGELLNVKSIKELHNVNADMLTSQDSKGKTSRSTNSLERDLPDIPKSSRRQSSGEFMDSPTKDKTRKSRQRKSSKNKTSSDGSRPSRNSMTSDLGEGCESPARNLPDIPKKSSRKTSKEVSSGGTVSRESTKHKLRSQNLHLDAESPSHSMTKSRNKQRPFDEDADREKGNGSEISQVLV